MTLPGPWHTGRSALLIEIREEKCDTTTLRLSQDVLDLNEPY